MALGDDYLRHRLIVVTEMLEQAVRELNKVQTEIRSSDPPGGVRSIPDDCPPRIEDECQ